MVSVSGGTLTESPNFEPTGKKMFDSGTYSCCGGIETASSPDDDSPSFVHSHLSLQHSLAQVVL